MQALEYTVDSPDPCSFKLEGLSHPYASDINERHCQWAELFIGFPAFKTLVTASC